jgi:multisubunit Na+/H+ antiporter MnhB subunit
MLTEMKPKRPPSLPENPAARFSFIKPAAAVCALLLFGILWEAFRALPTPRASLPNLVRETLPLSGVVNPVTAVILNFRGYDTLIEIAVLLLTAIGAQAAAGSDRARQPWAVPEPVLSAFFRLLGPLIIVIAGYLLWIGKHAPGGAFQAGSLLGSAAILGIFCTGWTPPAESGRQAAVLCLGTILFCTVGMGTYLAEPNFLHYPIPWAGTLILVIETGCTLSIAAALFVLFTHCLRT